MRFTHFASAPGLYLTPRNAASAASHRLTTPGKLGSDSKSRVIGSLQFAWVPWERNGGRAEISSGAASATLASSATEAGPGLGLTANEASSC